MNILPLVLCTRNESGILRALFTHSNPAIGLIIRRTILCMAVAVSAQGATPEENVSANPIDTVTIGGLNGTQSSNPITSKLDPSGKRQIFYAYITPASSDPAGSGGVTSAELVVRHVSDANVKTEYKLRNPNDTSQTYKILDDPWHMGPSIGIDRDGYIHVAANMHYHGWQYWKSMSPYNVTNGFLWKGCVLSSSAPEPQSYGAPSSTSPPGYNISYPHFFNDNNGRLYITYRMKVAGGWQTGCSGAGLAQYVESSGTWVAHGGTNYSWYPGLPAMGGAKAKLIIHHNDGAADNAGYQSHALQVAFDNQGGIHRMHLLSGLYSSRSPHQTQGPSELVYLIASAGSVEANGFQNWTFRNAGYTAIPDADLPAQLDVNPAELWVVYRRPSNGETLSGSMLGVGFQPGQPLVARPIVAFGERSSSSEPWTTKWKHFYQNPSGQWGWWDVGSLGEIPGALFFGQGEAGGGFVTSFVRSGGANSGLIVARTNDNGVTQNRYTLEGSTSGHRIDFDHARAFRSATNGQQLLIQRLGPWSGGASAASPNASMSTTLEFLDFWAPIEAEDNYLPTESLNPTDNVIGVQNGFLQASNGKVVTINDLGDKITLRFTLNSHQSGSYILKVRGRVYSGGYTFKVDGQPVDFPLDMNSRVQEGTTYIWWGKMVSPALTLAGGQQHSVEVTNTGRGSVDYLEVVPQ